MSQKAWLYVFMVVAMSFACASFVRSAAAQTASCSGNQTNTDINDDQCTSVANTGGSASASATGPTSSSATAEATGGGSASAMASNDSTDFATSANNSVTTSSASNGSFGLAEASDLSNSSATASDGSLAEAVSEEGSLATATASNGSDAEASAGAGSTTQVDASNGSTASGSASNGGFAIAQAVDGATAAASDSTPDTTVCAYATDGATASGSDTSAPVCEPSSSGSIAVVVSPAGNCGPVAESPCASVAGGDDIIRVVNPNGNANLAFPDESHEVCAMVYVFDDNQEMQACCGCPVSSAGMATFSSNRDLRSNIIGQGNPDPNFGWVDVVAAAPNTGVVSQASGQSNGHGCGFGQSDACNQGCDPTSQPGYAVSSTDTLLGSSTRTQTVVTDTLGVSITGPTEIPLLINRPRDPNNLTYLQTECGVLVGNSSGAGSCHCPVGIEVDP
jgi:hypothetical protein